ncbi:MAG: outer membrane beta-barrel protein [Acidobacteria bacterium]|nr:outer membrane beta-barrel protein [Acidobacteriota bacterium]MBV9927585.1 outer membrane beta-barrel protein [Acidobacteriota bacterium]
MTPGSTECAHYLPKRIIVAAALVLFCFFPARAQQGELSRPKVEVKATFGTSGFGEDDLSYPHVVAGGSVRFYVTSRFSVEPEYLYMRNSREDQDYFFAPGIAYDLTNPRKKVVPYLGLGVGVFRHRGRYYGSDFTTGQPRVYDTSYTAWTGVAGGGVKIFLNDRLFIAPDARIGFSGSEATAHATISVGYVLSGRSRRVR